jgi:hypothetical protein
MEARMEARMEDHPAHWTGGVQRHPRHRFQIRVEYVCADKRLVECGTLRDISMCGMFIEQESTGLRVGDSIRAPLRFFSESTSVWITGKVVRVQLDGVAIDFDPHSKRDESMLRSMLPLAEECFGKPS